MCMHARAGISCQNEHQQRRDAMTPRIAPVQFFSPAGIEAHARAHTRTFFHVAHYVFTCFTTQYLTYFTTHYYLILLLTYLRCSLRRYLLHYVVFYYTLLYYSLYYYCNASREQRHYVSIADCARLCPCTTRTHSIENTFYIHMYSSVRVQRGHILQRTHSIYICICIPGIAPLSVNR